MDNIRFKTIQICYALEISFSSLIFRLNSFLMTRYLVCLAIFSLAVDLARQVSKSDSQMVEQKPNKNSQTKERMKREVRRELIQKKFASQGLVHPSTLSLRLVYTISILTL